MYFERVKCTSDTIRLPNSTLCNPKWIQNGMHINAKVISTLKLRIIALIRPFFSISSGRISGGWYIHTQAYCMQRGKACRTHELRIAQRYPRLRPLFFFLVREVFTPPRAYHLLATPDTQGEGIRRKSHVACRHRRVERLILP